MKSALGYHVVLRLLDERPLATTDAERRVLARVVLEQGEHRGLVAFGSADDHLHAQLAADRATAGAFCRYAANSLRARLQLGAPFDRARIRPIANQRHGYSTFHYAARQDSKHGLALDPAREATCLPDLLGMRLLGTKIEARVARALPRLHEAELRAHFPPGTFDHHELELDVLADAAASVFALADVSGKSVDAYRARRAAVHVAGLDVATRDLATCLGVGVRAIQELRASPPEPAAVTAVLRQARLRAALSANPPRRVVRPQTKRAISWPPIETIVAYEIASDFDLEPPSTWDQPVGRSRAAR